MVKVIPHRKNPKPPKPPKRYVVQRKLIEFSTYDSWSYHGSYRFLWWAKCVARLTESYGYFYYRVIDTWEDD